MGTPSISTLSKLAIKSGTVTQLSDFSAATALEFISRTFATTRRFYSITESVGLVRRNSARCRITQAQVNGSLVLHPTPTEITSLLPLDPRVGQCAD
jgi:hypothetical protein